MGDGFVQDAPVVGNRFRTDPGLRRGLERCLPAEVFTEVASELDGMGALVAGHLPELAEQAERHPPRHVPFDAWGRRVDRIEVDPAWTRLVEIGLERGLVAAAYEDRYGSHGRVVQAGLTQLFEPVSATALCPIGMTDAAARVLLNHDAGLASRYVPRLTARRGGWTCGQWMTEKQGGSDVGKLSTVARPTGGGRWTLHGTKWFTSATTTDLALVLARPEGAPEGSRGLSLFLVELRLPDGGWNGLTVRRLKDKLGTRALPTAELDLEGTIAEPVGGLERGVGKVADMLNVARLGAAHSSVGVTGHMLTLARDYGHRREVFGHQLRHQPVHVRWIARLAAEYEAMLALSLRAAQAVGAAESGHDDGALARILAPLAKLACARQAVTVTSELLESFGGAGYLEDTGIPRMLRNVHVHCIWEGTTSVLAGDVVRALDVPGVMQALVDDLDDNLRTTDHPAIAPASRRVQEASQQLRRILTEDEIDARRLAWALARTYQGSLLCRAAGWELDKHADHRMALAADWFTAQPLIESAPADEGLPDSLAFPASAEPAQR